MDTPRLIRISGRIQLFLIKKGYWHSQTPQHQPHKTLPFFTINSAEFVKVKCIWKIFSFYFKFNLQILRIISIFALLVPNPLKFHVDLVLSADAWIN